MHDKMPTFQQTSSGFYKMYYIKYIKFLNSQEIYR